MYPANLTRPLRLSPTRLSRRHSTRLKDSHAGCPRPLCNPFSLEANMFLTSRNYSREPGTGLSHLNDRMQRLLNETLGGLDWQYRDSAAASWVPPVDVFEGADNTGISAEIPGVRPEDLEIPLDGNLLPIHGSMK